MFSLMSSSSSACLLRRRQRTRGRCIIINGLLLFVLSTYSALALTTSLPTRYYPKYIRPHGSHEIFGSLRCGWREPSHLKIEQSIALKKSTWHSDDGAIGLNSLLFQSLLMTSNTVGGLLIKGEQETGVSNKLHDNKIE